VQAEGIDLSPHYNYLAYDWKWLKPYLADDFEPVVAAALPRPLIQPLPQ